MTGPIQVRFAAETDRGQVRERNEDNYLIDRRLNLFIVADGMGGHQGGQVASALAVNAIRTMLRRSQDAVERCNAEPTPENRRSLIEHLGRAVQVANHLILDRSRSRTELSGMGTTLTLLLLAGNHGYMAHVGDSRLYLFRKGRAHQISEDHSLLNALLARGKIKSLDEARSRFKNAVIRAVGVDEHLDVDLLDFDLLPGDQFLLCSDGCYEYLEGPRLEAFIGPRSGAEPKTITSDLIKHALAKGGRDNITAIWVRATRARSSERSEDDDLVHLLGSNLIFSDLSEGALRKVLECGGERVVQLGEQLYSAQDDDPHIRILAVGRVGLFRDGVLVDTLDPGSCLDVDLLAEGSPRRVSARALTDCRLIELDAGEIRGMLKASKTLRDKLLRNTAIYIARRAHKDRDTLFAFRIHASRTGTAHPRQPEHTSVGGKPAIRAGGLDAEIASLLQELSEQELSEQGQGQEQGRE